MITVVFKISLLCITSGMLSLVVRIYVAVYHVHFFVRNNRRIERSLMARALHLHLLNLNRYRANLANKLI